MLNNDSTKYWGPYFWGLLHAVTALYPENPTTKDKEMIEKLINSYKYVLPCEQCKNHFKGNLESFSINSFMQTKTQYSSSRNGVILWGIKMHNIVNKMLGKYSLVSEDNFGINYLSNKFNENNVIYFFKNASKYSLNKINELDGVLENGFYDLFTSIAYFLLKKNIDIIQILKKKNIPFLLNKKKDLLLIINHL